MNMKKNYIAPITEKVNVRLFKSVLDGSSYGPYSYITAGGDDPNFGDAKETAFDAFDTEEDIWSGRQMKDVWER